MAVRLELERSIKNPRIYVTSKCDSSQVLITDERNKALVIYPTGLVTKDEFTRAIRLYPFLEQDGTWVIAEYYEAQFIDRGTIVDLGKNILQETVRKRHQLFTVFDSRELTYETLARVLDGYQLGSGNEQLRDANPLYIRELPGLEYYLMEALRLNIWPLE
tara:strand:- start:846 stop:1328 length:483 start_codon:yes stop_codon:yes gene_type:complete